MNLPPGLTFFNRKCPFCSVTISFINAYCADCFYVVVLPERERQKAAKLEKDMQEARLTKMKA